jgi:tetratricopeptide (TPR) repeat protein
VSLDLMAIKQERRKAFLKDMAARAVHLNGAGEIGNGLSERDNFYLDAANQLSSGGQYESADWCLQTAAKAAPNHPMILNNMGGNFTRWGRLADAEVALRRCIAHNPTHKTARKNLGDVLEKRERFHEAKAEYEDALRIDEGYARAWYGLGNVHLELEDFGSAEHCFRKAVYFDPSDHLSFINLGASLALRALWKEAIDAYSEARTLKPDFGGLDETITYLRSQLERN